MLPLTTLKSCRANVLPFGAFAWLSSGDQELVVIANPEDPFGLVLSSAPYVCGMGNLDGDALYTTDWQIEVDPESAKSSNQADSAHFLLMVSKNLVNILVRQPGASQWGHAQLPVPDGFTDNMQRGMAFSRWKIVKWIGDERHVLFETPSASPQVA